MTNMRIIGGNPPYAGGHCNITHVDAGALDLLYSLGCRSLLDVGCGPGGQVKAASLRGWRALGIDVDLALYRTPGVALIDLCDGPVMLPAKADVVWSVECAEHIPPGATANYIATLVNNCSRFLVLTASQKPGDRHVNIRPRNEWINIIQAAGMAYAPESLDALLKASTMEREFLRETGMVFEWLGHG